jgi:hypothetical protein
VCVSPFGVASIVGDGAAATNAAAAADAAVVVADLMGTGGAQKGASTRAVFYSSYPLPLFNPCYEVNWEAQALEAAQSAANPALSEGSTRVLHDNVLGTVTSHEVQRRRRRHHDVTMGEIHWASPPPPPPPPAGP